MSDLVSFNRESETLDKKEAANDPFAASGFSVDYLTESVQ